MVGEIFMCTEARYEDACYGSEEQNNNEAGINAQYAPYHIIGPVFAAQNALEDEVSANDKKTFYPK